MQVPIWGEYLVIGGTFALGACISFLIALVIKYEDDSDLYEIDDPEIIYNKNKQNETEE